MYDSKRLAVLKESLKHWESTHLKSSLVSLPERRESFLTTSSEPVNRLYTPCRYPRSGL